MIVERFMPLDAVRESARAPAALATRTLRDRLPKDLGGIVVDFTKFEISIQAATAEWRDRRLDAAELLLRYGKGTP